MGLREEIEQYRQIDGLISPDRKPTPDSTGNGLLYLSLYVILLARRGELTPKDIEDYLLTVESCERIALVPGLYQRSPTKCDQNGPDDYIFLSLASKIMGLYLAKSIVAYGRAHGWNFNNINPMQRTLNSDFRRFPHYVAHFETCAGNEPSFWLRFYFEAAILAGSFSVESANAALLQWALIEGRGYSSLASRTWERAFYKHWPCGFKGVLAEHLGAEHPIARHWR